MKQNERNLKKQTIRADWIKCLVTAAAFLLPILMIVGTALADLRAGEGDPALAGALSAAGLGFGAGILRITRKKLGALEEAYRALIREEVRVRRTAPRPASVSQTARKKAASFPRPVPQGTESLA